MAFKIATWNINSLRVRLQQVLAWLQTHQPDVLALQETKTQDHDFPRQEIEAMGYHVSYSGQKSYNGVAIVSRDPIQETVTDIPALEDPQRRILGVTVQDFRVINLYVPNGESVDSEKYHYKLQWLKHVKAFLLEEMKRFPKLLVLGDFNIAPADQDVWEPMLFEGRVLCSEPERGALRDILDLGLADCFRLFPQSEKSFSWWDYRANSFKRNNGVRIDHILASSPLQGSCERCYIDSSPRGSDRPSDHAPVIAEFSR